MQELWCWLLQALNFHTTLVGRHGEVVADSSTIRRKYMKGWFVIDLLSCIPDELFTLLFVSQKDVSAAHTEPHVAQLLGALKVLRLLRLGRVVRKVDMYLEFGGAVLLLLVVVFMLFAHWMACIWYSIGLYDVSRNITYGALRRALFAHCAIYFYYFYPHTYSCLYVCFCFCRLGVGHGEPHDGGRAGDGRRARAPQQPHVLPDGALLHRVLHHQRWLRQRFGNR